MNGPPCLDCDNRFVGCHGDGTCPAWQRWKARHDAVKAQIDTARAAEQEFQAAQADKRARYQCRQQRGNALGRKI